MNLVLSGPLDATLLNLCVAATNPREVIRLHEKAQRLVGAADTPATRLRIVALCEQARVDHAFVEEGLRFSDFKLLAMDMDSTLITIECIDEIADFAGKKKEVAAITEAAMRGEITDFAESLRRRVALLAGLAAEVLEQVYENRLTLTAGAERLIKTAKENNTHTILLSGGFTYFTNKLQLKLGFNETYANILEIVSEKITGNVVGTIFDAASKAKAVSDTLKLLKLQTRSALVIGDGANDIDMLNVTEHSIAFHANEIVKKSAKYEITYGSLATVLDYFI